MSCKLELINKQPYYLPGSKIEGNITCSLKKNREVQLIEVRFFGRESANVKVIHEALFHNDRSICYCQTVILKNAPVERGKSVYNFKIQVPQHIPSTYVGEYGSIRYDLEGVLILTQLKEDYSQISVQIFSPIDTNNFSSDLHKPVKRTDEKDLMGICGTGGHLSTSVQLGKRVFLCGESINMNVTINNATGVSVKKIRACLMEFSSCKLPAGDSAISKEKMVTCERYKTRVEKGEEKSFDVVLKIPEGLVVPNLKHSTLFKIQYTLHMYVIFPKFWRRPLDVCFKVYLGHIPIDF